MKRTFPFILNTKTLNKFERRYAQFFPVTPEIDQQCKNCMHFLIDKDNTGSCQVVEGGVNVDSWCRFWRTVEDLVVFNHQYTIHPGIGEALETEDKVDIKVIPSKKEVET